MSEFVKLTELKELTEQKSPNQNKQRVLVRHRLQAVGTVTKSTIHINAKSVSTEVYGLAPPWHHIPIWQPYPIRQCERMSVA